jgi:hypothetical protein
VYGGGLRLLSIDLAVEQGAGTYRMVGTFRTRGLAEVFVGMLLRAEA